MNRVIVAKKTSYCLGSCILATCCLLVAVPFTAAAEGLLIDLSDLDNTQRIVSKSVGTLTTAPLPVKEVPTTAINSRYQITESVSSKVYSSQSAVNGLRRNIELVKPKAQTLILSLPTKTAVSMMPSSPVIELSDMTSSSNKTSSTKKSSVVALTDQAVESDESMLSFIDNWLGIEPVKPWEKGTLAKKEMKPGGVAPEFDVFSEKVFAYKQGSVGGSGVGGGGCGCN